MPSGLWVLSKSEDAENVAKTIPTRLPRVIADSADSSLRNWLNRDCKSSIFYNHEKRRERTALVLK